jgi:mono/diheme cytochrome c family protein
MLAVLAFFVQCSSSSGNEQSDSPKSMVEDTEAQTSGSASEDWQSNKGVGPITTVSFDEEIDAEMAEEGKELYNIYCLACHKVDEDYIGPTPKGIYDRRTPEWVANMIINPSEMLAKDPIAKQLLVEYNNVPMASMGLDESQTRKILEYFRTLD